MEQITLAIQSAIKGNLVIILKTTTILAAVLIIFYQDLAIILNDALHVESMSHILAVPFLIAYVIYRKREMLRAVIPLENQDQPRKTKHLPTIIGIILSATSLMLYWHGSYTFTPLEYHMLALPIFATGLILILFNTQTLRQLAFPLALLIFLIPPPSEILYTLGSTMSVISSKASHTIINSLGVPSTLISEYGNPAIQITRLGGATITFAVDIACSGIYSMIGFLIFAAFIAYIIRDKPLKKLLLFLIGFSLTYILNIARITAILMIGYHLGEETALQLFHLLGGWILIFIGTLSLLIFAEKILHMQVFVKRTLPCMECNSNGQANHNFCLECGTILNPASITLRRKDIIKISAIVISAILLVAIQVPVFALTQAPAILLTDTRRGQQVPTEILPEISGYNLAFEYRDIDFEVLVKQDMALIYSYTPTNPLQHPVWVTIEISPRLSNLHRWETCLITWPPTVGYQPDVTQIDLREVQLVNNPPVIGRFFAFEYKTTNLTQVVLYWFEYAAFAVNSTFQYKHVKFSLIAYPKSLEDLPLLEKQLATIGTAVALYWQPAKTWSQLTFLISQEGARLAAMGSGSLVAVMVLYTLESRKRRKENARAFLKLSEPSRQIVNSVKEAEKTATPTLAAIATVYQNRTGKPIEKEKLLNELSIGERTGMIKSCISNIQDKPIQVWKTQIS